MSIEDHDPREPDDAVPDEVSAPVPATKPPFDSLAYLAGRLLNDSITRLALDVNHEAKHPTLEERDSLESDRRQLMIERAWESHPSWRIGALVQAAARSVAGENVNLDDIEDLALAQGLAAVAEPVEPF